MNKDVRTIGQPFSRMSQEEEKMNAWQACSNLCKSIAMAYEKAGDKFKTKSEMYWLKSTHFDRDILEFIEKKYTEK